ncbi:hypothetical protein ABNX05_24940 [Lysinibacillus sp. M3]|uniref:DUF4083 domain-containing protein n=1 Tax=Lysinibacillus zambalensis TaxID=3160866 RepID=A0ABV1MZA7_9BACI
MSITFVFSIAITGLGIAIYTISQSDTLKKKVLQLEGEIKELSDIVKKSEK